MCFQEIRNLFMEEKSCNFVNQHGRPQGKGHGGHLPSSLFEKETFYFILEKMLNKMKLFIKMKIVEKIENEVQFVIVKLALRRVKTWLR